VIQNARAAYKSSSDPQVKRELAASLQKHGAAMETVVGIVNLNAKLVNEERLEAWAGAAESAAEMQSRRQRIQVLCEKMGGLGRAVKELRDEVDAEESG